MDTAGFAEPSPRDRRSEDRSRRSHNGSWSPVVTQSALDLVGDVESRSKRSRRPAPREELELLVKKARRIGELSDRIVVNQYAIHHEEQTLDSCGSFLRQSAEDIIQAAVSVRDGKTVDSGLPQLQDLLVRARADAETFKAQSERIQSLRAALIQHESRLKARVDKLKNLLDKEVANSPRPLPEPTLSLQSDITSNTSSVHPSTHTSTPTLLAEYFDSKGDIGVFRERLADTEYNYQEGLIERESKKDRGDTLMLSDEQYYDRYISERKEILDDLAQAEERAEILAEKCEAAGLDTRTRDKPSPSEANTKSPNAYPTDVNARMAASLPLLQLDRAIHTRNFTSLANTSRVRNWLESIHKDGQSPLIDSNPEPNLERTYDAGSYLSKPFGSKMWRSYGTEDVASAATQLPAHWYVVVNERSKLDVGLSMSIRRMKTDPGCLPRVKINDQQPPPTPYLPDGQWSVKSSPDMSQLDITKPIKNISEYPVTKHTTPVAGQQNEGLGGLWRRLWYRK